MAETQVPDELLYTEEHEYVKRTGKEDEVIVGVTDYAQNELSDVVFVELPEVGVSFDKMEPFGTIEAVKAVSELYTPVAGEILEVNEALDEDPALVNSSPYQDGWMIRLKVKDPGELEELLDAGEYRALVAEG